MIISIDDMKSIIQEWYAQANDFETLLEIHYAVLAEANKQSIFMCEMIAENENR